MMYSMSTLALIGATLVDAKETVPYCNLFDMTKDWKDFYGDKIVSWAVGSEGEFLSVLKHAKECKDQDYKGIAVGFFKLDKTEEKKVFCTNMLEKIKRPDGTDYPQVDSGVQIDCASTFGKCVPGVECVQYDQSLSDSQKLFACKWYYYNYTKKDKICNKCSFTEEQEEVLANVVNDDTLWTMIKESGCGTSASKELADIDEYGGKKPYSVYGVSDYDVDQVVGLVSDKCLTALDDPKSTPEAIKEACETELKPNSSNTLATTFGFVLGSLLAGVLI